MIYRIYNVHGVVEWIVISCPEEDDAAGSPTPRISGSRSFIGRAEGGLIIYNDKTHAPVIGP